MSGSGEVWKYVAISSLSVLIGIGVQSLREPKDVVTERELTEQVLQLQSKIDAQTREISALRASVNQQSVDIARIAEKVGVPSHPVIAPASFDGAAN